MDKPSFDDIYMNLALSLAKRSHCVKMKVGAVIAKETRIVSVGYNGPPAGTHNCNEEWPESGCPRSSKGSCSLAVHAEENAILYAAKNKVDLERKITKDFMNTQRMVKNFYGPNYLSCTTKLKINQM